jgi:hypothetical protein
VTNTAVLHGFSPEGYWYVLLGIVWLELFRQEFDLGDSAFPFDCGEGGVWIDT